jgi:hypothetical protein
VFTTTRHWSLTWSRFGLKCTIANGNSRIFAPVGSSTYKTTQSVCDRNAVRGTYGPRATDYSLCYLPPGHVLATCRTSPLFTWLVSHANPVYCSVLKVTLSCCWSYGIDGSPGGPVEAVSVQFEGGGGSGEMRLLNEYWNRAVWSAVCGHNLLNWPSVVGAVLWLGHEPPAVLDQLHLFAAEMRIKGKVAPVLNQVPLNQDVLGEWIYSSLHSWPLL